MALKNKDYIFGTKRIGPGYIIGHLYRVSKSIFINDTLFERTTQSSHFNMKFKINKRLIHIKMFL